MKRLLVTGATGFVGSNVLTCSTKWFRPAAFHRSSDVSLPDGIDEVQVDLTDHQRVAREYRAVRPDVVLHLAAMANIDSCEANPETATQINVGVTEHLLSLAAEDTAHFILVSTDTVFDGEATMYREDAEVRPLNHYGRTKAEAERLARHYRGPWTIVRPSLIVGFPLLQRGNAFLPQMLRSIDGGGTVYFPSNEYRTPVDSVTLAAALLEIAADTITGLMHIAGNQRMSRLEMAQRIARHLGRPTDLVQDSAQQPNANRFRAPRPSDVSLDNTKAKALLRTPMLDLEAALDLVMSQRSKEEYP